MNSRTIFRHSNPLMHLLLVTLVVVTCTATQAAEVHADLVLRNGEVLTMDPQRPRAQALAIKGQRIVAVGNDAEMTTWQGSNTRVYDLSGRTVIPGLVDTHAHAIRGGQTYTFETYWFDTVSLQQALQLLSDAAGKRPTTQWAAVVGSWHPDQFQEKRAPIRADLDRAVPTHPAYVQYLYDYALLNTRGIQVLGLVAATPPALPPGIRVERDSAGRATGKLFGGVAPFNALFARISAGVDRKASLHSFFADLASRGLTGFIDPGAGPPEAFAPLFGLRAEGRLNLHAGYRISALAKSGEADWYRNILAYRAPHYDDGQLAFLGIGENVVTAMNDGVTMGPGFVSTPAAREELRQVALLAAERGVPLEIHAYTDDSASAILDVFEQVARQHDLRPLRWSIAHLNTGSARTLERMRRLGIAYTVQMGPYFEGPAIAAANSPQRALQSPPLRMALDKGLMVTGGTDSTRIGVAGVWQAIAYYVSGRSLGGTIQKPRDQLLSVEEALPLFTRNAAWLGFDEDDRGSLVVGKLADVAVLDRPVLRIPADQLGDTRSLLTLLRGRVVHDSRQLQAATSGTR